MWPEAVKRAIRAVCALPGASVSMVARQYEVNTSLVSTWRKLYAEAPAVAAPQLVPMAVAPEEPPLPPPPPSLAVSADIIEIELPRDDRVRIGGN